MTDNDLKPAETAYQPAKLIRWRGTDSNFGVVAVTPTGEEALRLLLQAGGIPTARGREHLICVREPWAEQFLSALCLLTLNGSILAHEDVCRCIRKMSLDAIESAVNPASKPCKPSNN